jgi:AcrR family transcriptional regulator
VPSRVDPTLRDRLVAELVGRLGDDDLPTIRSLAAAVGTSTMTIYTQFGGMPGLWSAARQEGFRRLAAALSDVREREDPAEQIVAIASAYVGNAFAHPGLYLTMFDARHELRDLTVADASFVVLVAATGRARKAGRFRDDLDDRGAAVQMWAMAHGLLMLVLTGVVPATTVAEQLPAMTCAAFVGFGDEAARARRSVERGWDPPNVEQSDSKDEVPPPRPAGPPD